MANLTHLAHSQGGLRRRSSAQNGFHTKPQAKGRMLGFHHHCTDSRNCCLFFSFPFYLQWGCIITALREEEKGMECSIKEWHSRPLCHDVVCVCESGTCGACGLTPMVAHVFLLLFPCVLPSLFFPALTGQFKAMARSTSTTELWSEVTECCW